MIRAMMIIGAFALVVGLTLYTLLDALRTHQDQMRTFPKWLWIIAVIFFPVVGPLLWLLLGRPRAVRAPKTQQDGGFTGSRRGTPPPATSSPDDDEEYLRWLKTKADRQRRSREKDAGTGSADGGTGEPSDGENDGSGEKGSSK